MDEFYQGLITEIEFWRELIDQSDLNHSSAEYIRMQQALQFAMRKLMDCECMQKNPENELSMH